MYMYRLLDEHRQERGVNRERKGESKFGVKTHIVCLVSKRMEIISHTFHGCHYCHHRHHRNIPRMVVRRLVV